MKLRLTFILSLSFITAVNAQVLQKLSLGVQGGLNSPTNITLQGTNPYIFEPIRTTDVSTAFFLQYELPNDLYLRSTFKKARLNIKSTHRFATGTGVTHEA